MLLPLVQFLVLLTVMLLPAAAIAFPILLFGYLARRTHGRGALISGCFLAGALLSGEAVWRLALADWTLPFWTTVEASGNAMKFGHPLEHAAENNLCAVIVAALFGGLLGAAAAALAARMIRKFTLPGGRRPSPVHPG